MYMNSDRNDELDIYDFHFHIRVNIVFVLGACFRCMRKSHFAQTNNIHHSWPGKSLISHA